MSRRIYVASSWRNDTQPGVVAALREQGHEVYDFRHPHDGYANPNPEARNFGWAEIDPRWKHWTPRGFAQALLHPIAEQAFESDYGALKWADTGVLLLPCGRSAHLEAGHFAGAGKSLYIVLAPDQEPELMYRMATRVCTDVDDLLKVLGAVRVTA